MKTLPFDLEKALAGAKVVNGRGDIVTGLHRIDTPGDLLGDRLAGVVAGVRVQLWNIDGIAVLIQTDDLLLVAPEPIVRWVNFYGPPEGPRCADYFDTEFEADECQRAVRNVFDRVVKTRRLFGRAIRVEIEPEVQP